MERAEQAVFDFKEKGKEDIYFDYLKGKIKREEFLSNVPSSIKESVINSEISSKSIKGIFDKIDNLADGNQVDLIIGGPPCQALFIQALTWARAYVRLESEEEYRMQRITIDLSAALAAALEAAVKFTHPGE